MNLILTHRIQYNKNDQLKNDKKRPFNLEKKNCLKNVIIGYSAIRQTVMFVSTDCCYLQQCTSTFQWENNKQGQ